MNKWLAGGTLGTAGLVTAGLIGLQVPASSAAQDQAYQRNDDLPDVVMTVDDDDDDDTMGKRDGTRSKDTRSRNTGNSRSRNDHTNSRMTGVSRDRDHSRGDKTRDWTRDGKGDKKKRDWSANKTNDKSRNDTRK
jgi:hypothetical protein